MPGILLLILVLVALNALYVAAEFASVAVKSIRIQALAEEGHPIAKRLLPHLRDSHALDRYVAACQIGITVSSLVLGAFGQKRLAAPLEALVQQFQWIPAEQVANLTATVVLILLTGFQVVLGELLPKAIALRFPERVALALTLPMLASLWLFSIFIKVLNGTGTLFLRWMGVPAHGHKHVHTPAELVQLLEQGAQRGAMERGESTLLRRAFRFADTLAREVMIPRNRVIGCDLELSTAELLQVLKDSSHSRFPAYRKDLDHFEGILYLKDLLGSKPPEDLKPLLRSPLTFPASVKAEKVFEEMRSQRVQMAFLIDEYGGLEGLVTMEDLCELLVGDIRDEFDAAAPRMLALGEQRWQAQGDLHLRHLEEALQTEFFLEEVHTLGGLIMHHLQQAPTVGARVVVENWAFTVESLLGHGVGRVRIEKGEN